jgi:hypothetical protein
MALETKRTPGATGPDDASIPRGFVRRGSGARLQPTTAWRRALVDDMPQLWREVRNNVFAAESRAPELRMSILLGPRIRISASLRLTVARLTT